MNEKMTKKLRCLLVLVAVLAWSVPSLASPDSGVEVKEFEKQVEAAIIRGDGEFLGKICASDFSFTHGDGWTTGGAPLKVENRDQYLASNGKARYLYRELDPVKVELHGDIAITYGRYRARFKPGEPEQREFVVWFERVYARRNGHWQYLSHRTVRGPVYDEGSPPRK